MTQFHRQENDSSSNKMNANDGQEITTIQIPSVDRPSVSNIIKNHQPSNTSNNNSSSKPSKKLKKEVQDVVVDISQFSPADLNELRKNDPFLYYSIPAVKSAAQLFKEVDCISSSTRMEVKRESRISFECWGDLFWEDMLLHDDHDGSSSREEQEEKFEDAFDLLMKSFEAQ